MNSYRFNRLTYTISRPLNYEGFLFMLIIFSAKSPVSWNLLSSIKSFTPLIFLAFLVVRYKTKIILPEYKDKYSLILISLFSTICLLSLLWSSNTTYGLNKLWGIVLIIIPLTGSYLILDKLYGYRLLKVLFFWLVFIGILLTIIFFATHPFSYKNSLNELGYSHVGYGRLISYAFILSLVNILLKIELSTSRILVAAFLGSGLVLSGLRGAWISVIISTIFFLLNQDTNVIKNYAFRIVLVIPIIVLIILIQPKYYQNIEKRIANLKSIVVANSNFDGSINARMQAYEVSYNMFLDKPFTGRGIGGFNIVYKNKKLPQAIEYPHNMLVEVLVELGLVGFSLLMLLFWLTAKKIKRINGVLYLIFLNGFILSLFSGNIADQKILFVLIGAFTFRPNNWKNCEYTIS